MNNIEKLYKYIPSNGIINWDMIKKDLLSPFLVKLENTPQDKTYHAEGNVLIHTMMVCEELIKLEDYDKLPKIQKLELFLASLFHDIGKTISTKEIDDHIESPNHGKIGSNITREYFIKHLKLAGTDEYLSFRETICMLIKYHTAPIYLGKTQDEKKIIKLSLLNTFAKDYSIKLQTILSIADVKGRLGINKEERLLDIDISILYAKELNVYETNYTFTDNYTKNRYFERNNIPLKSVLYNDTWGEVIMLVALPGTGKDTYIINNLKEYPVISLDDIRERMKIKPNDNQGIIYTTAKEEIKDLLRKKIPFVYNATNLTNLIRSKQIKLFHDYNACVKIIYLETSFDEVLKRNNQRKRIVSEKVIYEMLKTISIPEPDEAEEIEWICI